MGHSPAVARHETLLGGVVLLAALPGLLFAFIVWPAALVAIVSVFVPIAAPGEPGEAPA